MKKDLKSIYKSFAVLLGLIAILILPYFVFAQPLETLDKIRTESGFAPVTAENNFAHNAGKITAIIFSIMATIFICLMLYAGYNWMTAAGDSSKVDKAQETIRHAIIGLIVAAGAYAITEFVLKSVLG